MKKRLLLVGAGNVGGYLSYSNSQLAEYDVLGFLDDDHAKVGKEIYGRKVLGLTDEIEKYITGDRLAVFIGIASPEARFKLAQKLYAKSQLDFPSFIPKGVWLSEEVKIGKGTILYPGVSVNYETAIGDFVIINMNCAIGHNCRIDNYATLAPGVNLGGFTHIEEGAEIGIGVSTRQNVKVGKFAVIGGQSMLVRDVAPHAIVLGVPGRVSDKK